MAATVCSSRNRNNNHHQYQIENNVCEMPYHPAEGIYQTELSKYRNNDFLLWIVLFRTHRHGTRRKITTHTNKRKHTLPLINSWNINKYYSLSFHFFSVLSKDLAWQRNSMHRWSPGRFFAQLADIHGCYIRNQTRARVKQNIMIYK